MYWNIRLLILHVMSIKLISPTYLINYALIVFMACGCVFLWTYNFIFCFLKCVCCLWNALSMGMSLYERYGNESVWVVWEWVYMSGMGMILGAITFTGFWSQSLVNHSVCQHYTHTLTHYYAWLSCPVLWFPVLLTTGVVITSQNELRVSMLWTVLSDRLCVWIISGSYWQLPLSHHWGVKFSLIVHVIKCILAHLCF